MADVFLKKKVCYNVGNMMAPHVPKRTRNRGEVPGLTAEQCRNS